MKKIHLSFLALAMGTAIVSCGPSAEEIALKEKATQDSLNLVAAEQHRMDSIASAEAEQHRMDSIAMATAEQNRLDSIAAAGSKNKGGARPKAKAEVKKDNANTDLGKTRENKSNADVDLSKKRGQ